MTKLETAQLQKLASQVDTILDAPATVNPSVTNIKVLEGLLDDVRRMSLGKAPKYIDELLAEETKSKASV